jgi:hypothetical protein
MVYIGVTKQTIKDRVYQHLQTILKFHKFFNNTEVGHRFNKKYHNYKEHFRVLIVKNKLDETISRRSFEQDIIAITNSFGTTKINRKIYKTKNYFQLFIHVELEILLER